MQTNETRRSLNPSTIFGFTHKKCLGNSFFTTKYQQKKQIAYVWLKLYHYFWFYSLFNHYNKVQKFQISKHFLNMSNSLSWKSLSTDSLISCKFHLKFLQNNCQEISSPSSSYFCFSLRLLCTVHTRDFDLFHFMTLVLQEYDKTYLYSYVSSRWVDWTQIFFIF